MAIRCAIEPSLRDKICAMEIKVNGLTHGFDMAPTVAELLRSLKLEGKSVAIERNGNIVPKSAHQTTPLTDGDRLEIVFAVGGG